MYSLLALFRGFGKPADSQAATWRATEAQNFSFRPTDFRDVVSRPFGVDVLDTDTDLRVPDSDLLAQFSESRPRLRYQAELRQQALSNTLQHAVVYISKSLSSEHEHDQLRNLRAESAVRNFRAGVNSSLVLQDGLFCQWLQGEEAAVESTLARIKRDPRHTALMTIYRGPAPLSMLDAWSMGLRNLYVGKGNAFARAQLLRYQASEAGYTKPRDAWTDFTGVTNQPKTLDGQPTAALSERLGEPITILGLRSRQGAQMLMSAAEGGESGLGVSRWASVLDANCDLQAVGGVLPLGKQPAYLAALSVRALRVAAVREAVRNRKRVVITLSHGDSAELNYILSSLEDNTPHDFAPTSLTVLAPEWTKAAAEHARHLLSLRDWPGDVHALDMSKRQAWRHLGEPIPD